MTNQIRKPELLAPAGDLESIDAALRFGADAVYIGGSFLQLRAAKAGFTDTDLREAVSRVHKESKKLYVTVNSYAYSFEIPRVGDYVRFLKEAGVDGIIVADLGVLTAAKEACPDMKVIVSTQFNAMNYKTGEALYNMGADRIVLARELSLEEIREFREKCPKELEIETFVHGAMCMAYSGRCLISAFLTGRSANRGECAQPCRWNYRLEEEKRPGEYFAIEETEKGTAILSSRDLCALPFVDKLAEAGVCSLKIEGRMKSPFYIASVTNAYRMALDKTAPFEAIAREICSVSHRPYTAGFYFDKPGSEIDQAALGEFLATGTDHGEYIRERTFIGAVLNSAEYIPDLEKRAEEERLRIAGIKATKPRYKTEDVTPRIDVPAVKDLLTKGFVPVMTRNYFESGETVEILSPGKPGIPAKVDAVVNELGNFDRANHPMVPVLVRMDAELLPGDLLRSDTFNKKRGNSGTPTENRKNGTGFEADGCECAADTPDGSECAADAFVGTRGNAKNATGTASECPEKNSRRASTPNGAERDTTGKESSPFLAGFCSSIAGNTDKSGWDFLKEKKFFDESEKQSPDGICFFKNGEL